jgi:glycine dehydrogenase subunit 1
LHPEYREVLKTITAPKEMEILELPYTSGDGRTNITLLNEVVDETSSAIIVQSPNFFGAIEEVDRCAEVAHSKGALLIVTITEPIALGILEPPGRLGADIVVGEGMSFGSPTSFGGPCLGIFAAREKFLRQMPGRICGMTKDMDGKRGFVLTISTREQHIRREKATSNICSNETLLATRAAMYLSLIGKEGLREIAIRNYSNAEYLKERLSKIKGIRIPFSAPTFNEFVIETELDGDELLNRMLKHKVFGGVALGRWYKEMKKAILVASTECHTKRELDEYVRIASKCIEG